MKTLLLLDFAATSLSGQNYVSYDGKTALARSSFLRHQMLMAAPSGALGDPSVLGFWPLSEGGTSTTAIDLSGRGNVGQLAGTRYGMSGASYYTSDAKFGPWAAFFTYTNGVHPNSASLALPGNSLSVTMWARPDVYLGYYENLVATSMTTLIQLEIAGKIRECNVNGCAIGATGIEDGKWHFIAFAGDSVSGRYYIDGQTTPDLTIASSTTDYSNYWIGSGPPPSYTFRGSIGETRIYTRALSVAEINTIYNAQKGF